MIIYKEKQITVEEWEKVICDICGKEFTDIMEIQEFQYIRFTGGYTSVFGDGAEIECVICQYCLYKMIREPN